VIVENRAGAVGLIAIDEPSRTGRRIGVDVRRAREHHAVAEHLQDAAFRPTRDFVPIALHVFAQYC
jgi:tripartite-type tricarboxylate transporter receptor subunit TctC